MKRTLIKIIRIIAWIVLIASLTMLSIYLIGDYRDSQAAKGILSLLGSDAEPIPDVLYEYSALYAANPDTIGWLKIDGTRIDNVVMFAPNEYEKYIHTDFYGKYSYRGCLYVDENCDILHSDNIIIYGHHMKDGTMFGDLVEYMDKSFYEKHRTFTFDTIYEKHTYEVVAAIKTKIPPESSNVFRYYRYTGVNDTDMFYQYVQFINSNKLYDTGIKLQEGDKLLTLSTCAYHTQNGRFIVVARQIS